jgi:hypothetical protein
MGEKEEMDMGQAGDRACSPVSSALVEGAREDLEQGSDPT